MARPRVFVSSTYYDLKHIRNSLEGFVSGLGYEPVLFENGDIPFHHDRPSDESCYAEIGNCHMLVLIVGNRYGSAVSSENPKGDSDSKDDEFFRRYNSITRQEYETARKRKIPIFIFVEKNVLAEYHTYKANRTNLTIRYAHVQNVNVFRLLDDILEQRQNNFIREFDHFDDISCWLRDQWAGLFAESLSRRVSEVALADLASQIQNLTQVSSVLKEYSESIIRKIEPQQSKQIISRQRQRLRAAQLERFGREPMIEFICTTHKIESDKLAKAMETSDTIESFLEASGFEKAEAQSFADLHGDIAKKDYVEIKRRYFSAEAKGETTE